MMSINVKSLSKILTRLIEQNSRSFINPDEVGFIPGVQGCNKQKSINVIFHINRINDKDHIIIPVDIAKAFDKIQHGFMITTQQIKYRRKVSQYNKDNIV